MPAQWFFAPYVRRDYGEPSRYCLVDDFTTQIVADGGAWAEFECGGGPGSDFLMGVAGCKVNAAAGTLAAIDAVTTVMGVPVKWLELDTSLSTATTAERTFLRDTLRQALGYSTAEMDVWLGLSGNPTQAQRNTAMNAKTWGDLLDFLATRWYSPVWDPAGSQVGYQGIVYPGVLACDGRTVASTGRSSRQVSPTPRTPASVAAAVPS